MRCRATVGWLGVRSGDWDPGRYDGESLMLCKDLRKVWMIGFEVGSNQFIKRLDALVIYSNA